MPAQLFAEQEWICNSVSRIKADGSDARISTGVEQCSGFRRHPCISAWHAGDPVLCVNHSGHRPDCRATDLSAVSAHGDLLGGCPNNQSGGAGPGLQTDREGRSPIGAGGGHANYAAGRHGHNAGSNSTRHRRRALSDDRAAAPMESPVAEGQQVSRGELASILITYGSAATAICGCSDWCATNRDDGSRAGKYQKGACLILLAIRPTDRHATCAANYARPVDPGTPASRSPAATALPTAAAAAAEDPRALHFARSEPDRCGRIRWL